MDTDITELDELQCKFIYCSAMETEEGVVETGSSTWSVVPLRIKYLEERLASALLHVKQADPELNGFFVDALFPRTFEIWWL